jgi:hypothetical protein
MAGPRLMERMGRMTALADRAILALIDGQDDTLAAVLDRIATFDLEPGRPAPPETYDPWKFPVDQVLKTADAFLQISERVGGVTDAEVTVGAGELLAVFSPPDRRAAAITLLEGGEGPFDLSAAGGPGPTSFLTIAAIGAWIALQPKIFPSREALRLTFVTRIRKAEAEAAAIPEDQRIEQVSDADALELLRIVAGEQFAARTPARRSAWTLIDLDIVSILKQHLLETPAQATTDEQAGALRDQIFLYLAAAAGTPPAEPHRPGQRQQPKGKKKRKKK